MRDVMTPKARAFVAFALGVFVTDRLGKAVVMRLLEPGDRQPLLGDLVGIVHVRASSTAISWLEGLGDFAPLAALGLVSIASAVLVLGFYRSLAPGERTAAAALGGVFAGVTGNLFDRLLHGVGIEFLRVGPLSAERLPDFDLCDVAIVLGLVTLTVELLATELAGRAEERRQR